MDITNCAPNLDMSDNYHFYIFLSHVWSTGQDKTHNFAKMLQVHLPGVRVCLDVDELESIDVLEGSVADSRILFCFIARAISILRIDGRNFL